MTRSHLLCTGAVLAAVGLGGAFAGGATAASSTAPRIDDIEVEALAGGKLRLETELIGRATRVTFTYRGRSYKARKQADGDWTRTVTARGGDRDDSIVRLKVRACNGTKCVTRTSSDDA